MTSAAIQQPKQQGGAQRRTAERRVDGGRETWRAAIVPDPMIQHGPFKVLERTDGAFIVFDTRAAPGRGTAALFSPARFLEPKKAAEAESIRLAALADRA